jgi:hypothetical protein
VNLRIVLLWLCHCAEHLLSAAGRSKSDLFYSSSSLSCYFIGLVPYATLRSLLTLLRTTDNGPKEGCLFKGCSVGLSLCRTMGPCTLWYGRCYQRCTLSLTHTHSHARALSLTLSLARARALSLSLSHGTGDAISRRMKQGLPQKTLCVCVCVCVCVCMEGALNRRRKARATTNAGRACSWIRCSVLIAHQV